MNEKMTCGTKLLMRRFNLCRFNQSTSSNLLLQNFFMDASKTFNFPIKCPFKPGYYEMKNFKLNVKLPIDQIGSLVGFLKICVNFKMSGILNTTKSTSDLISVGAKLVYEN